MATMIFHRPRRFHPTLQSQVGTRFLGARTLEDGPSSEPFGALPVLFGAVAFEVPDWNSLTQEACAGLGFLGPGGCTFCIF